MLETDSNLVMSDVKIALFSLFTHQEQIPDDKIDTASIMCCYRNGSNGLKMIVLNDKVRGIAVLGEQLFILMGGMNKIIIYYRSSATLIQNLPVGGLQKPVDIAAGHQLNCLYVVDAALYKIFKVTMLADGKPLVSRWLNEDKSVSVCSIRWSNVIVTCKSSLFEFSSTDGSKVKDVKLLAHISNVQHAVKMADKVFVIVHDKTIDIFNYVYDIDGKGKLLQTHEGTPGFASGHLSIPIRLVGLVVDTTWSLIINSN